MIHFVGSESDRDAAMNGPCLDYVKGLKAAGIIRHIAMVNKYYDLASMQTDVPASVRAHYEALEHHADECVNCKGCESRCPFFDGHLKRSPFP